MIEYDLSRARRAVQYLVDSPYFHHHVKKLSTTVPKPRSMPFKDEAECLNELLIIGRQSPEAMQNLIEVAEAKRGGKNDYQRQYMAAKRQRDRKVLELEELMTGKKLNIDQRAALLHRQYDIWNREKTEHLARHADRSWAERNEQTRHFWERKEHELDALIREARASGPVKRKYVVKVTQEPKTGFGKALAAVVKPNGKPNGKPIDKPR